MEELEQALQEDADFQQFAAMFREDVQPEQVMAIYRQSRQKDVHTMGSMKNRVGHDTEVKDHYTRDEALRFTRKDFDRNPALFHAVERSMQRW